MKWEKEGNNNMSKKIICAVLVLALLICLIQIPAAVGADTVLYETDQIKNFGGEGSDSFASVAIDDDGNMVCVGTSAMDSFETGDWTGMWGGLFRSTSAVIVKYGADGTVINRKDFGGTGVGGTGEFTGSNEFTSVIAVDGGYITVGSSNAFGSGSNLPMALNILPIYGIMHLNHMI